MDAFGNILHSDGAGGDVLVVDRYQGGRERASERASFLWMYHVLLPFTYASSVRDDLDGWRNE